MDEELKEFISANANTEADTERSYQILQDIPDLKKELMDQQMDEDDLPKILVKHAPRAWCFIWTRYTTKVE